MNAPFELFLILAVVAIGYAFTRALCSPSDPSARQRREARARREHEDFCRRGREALLRGDCMFLAEEAEKLREELEDVRGRHERATEHCRAFKLALVESDKNFQRLMIVDTQVREYADAMSKRVDLLSKANAYLSERSEKDQQIIKDLKAWKTTAVHDLAAVIRHAPH